MVADLKHVPPHIGYHAEFASSALKDVRINTAEPPKFGEPWNSALLIGMRGVADPQDTLLPDVLPRQIW